MLPARATTNSADGARRVKPADCASASAQTVSNSPDRINTSHGMTTDHLHHGRLCRPGTTRPRPGWPLVRHRFPIIRSSTTFRYRGYQRPGRVPARRAHQPRADLLDRLDRMDAWTGHEGPTLPGSAAPAALY